MRKIFLTTVTLGIVICALALSQKKCFPVCVANVSGGSCNVQIGTTPVNNGHTPLSRFMYCPWDGTQTGCTTKTCTTPVTLYNE